MSTCERTVRALVSLSLDASLNPHRQLRRLERSRARSRQLVQDASVRMCPQLPPVAPSRPRELSYQRRLEIRLADWTCRYCLLAPAETVDHVVAWTRGGSNSDDNLVGACRDCNGRKGDLSVQEAGMVLHPPLRWVMLGIGLAG